MSKKKVAVLIGGLGSEREVSLKTGAAFVRAVEKLGYPFEVIDAGKDLPQVLASKKIDVALLALHGRYAEDGTVQGILEYMKIPYTGSGVLSSALAMDKIATKQVLSHWGIPTAPWEVADLTATDPKSYKLQKLQIPVVTKPPHEGSTVGITIVRTHEELTKGLELAKQYDKKILIEKYIDGMEITVPIWFGKALPIIEIIPNSGFYDFKRKYTPGEAEHILPARLTPELTKKCEALALETFKALGCRHYGRVDMRVDKQNSPWVLEVNTLPGCTEVSLFPESAAAAGISFEKFIETLIENATLDYR